MKPIIIAAACFALALGGCSPTAPSPTATGATQLGLGASVDIAAVGARLAALRAQNGVTRPLAHSAALQAAAQAHADDMARSGNFSHTGSDRSTLATRLQRAGFNSCYANESIAFGQPNIAQVFTDWMGSSGHRRNILAAQATQFGFARVGTYSVLVMGRSC